MDSRLSVVDRLGHGEPEALKARCKCAIVQHHSALVRKHRTRPLRSHDEKKVLHVNATLSFNYVYIFSKAIVLLYFSSQTLAPV